MDTRDPREDARLQDENLKREFASQILRFPDELYHVSHTLVGYATDYDLQVGLQVARYFPSDPIVLAEIARLREASGPAVVVPTKEDAALIAYRIADDAKHTVSERLAALRTFSEITGYISKGPVAPAAVQLNAPSVMVVTDKGPEDVWTQGAQQQQAKLIEDARATAQPSAA